MERKPDSLFIHLDCRQDNCPGTIDQMKKEILTVIAKYGYTIRTIGDHKSFLTYLTSVQEIMDKFSDDNEE